MAGVAHADNPYRASFAYDVMESVRPDVDSWLFDFVQNHKFLTKDFYKKKDGRIRLTLKITPVLAETVSLWFEKIEAVIEQVKMVLLEKR